MCAARSNWPPHLHFLPDPSPSYIHLRYHSSSAKRLVVVVVVLVVEEVIALVNIY